LSLGKAPAQAIAAWNPWPRVAIGGVCGMSHFVVDEKPRFSCRDAARYLTHSLQPARRTCEATATAHINGRADGRMQAPDRQTVTIWAGL
jgi:hypothetical protein